VLITDAIINAYLRCPLKAHHLISGRPPPVSEHEGFAEQLDRPHLARVRCALPASAVALPLVHNDLSTHPDGIERIGKTKRFAPVRIFPQARLSDVDRLTLGFDGLVMKHLCAKAPAYGVAIVGPNARRTRLALASLIRRAARAVESLRLLSSGPAPRLMLNRNCATCGFRDACRERAIAVDDLSLMAGLKKAELVAAHKKGIFTITQFAHTFRPNRRRKRLRHEWALQALLIRERGTHVLEPPELPHEGFRAARALPRYRRRCRRGVVLPHRRAHRRKRKGDPKVVLGEALRRRGNYLAEVSQRWPRESGHSDKWKLCANRSGSMPGKAEGP